MKTREERAKELFLKYNGNRFYMDREGEGSEYEGYHIPKETEELWAKEFISGFLESEMMGREAIRAYSTATELLKSDRADDSWERCLYYPLRAKQLDDVTILYMLQASFQMAERAAGKNCFSRDDANFYLKELDAYAQTVQGRAKKGTMTRAADYLMQEFSDPVYIADYLENLKQKWEGLFR